MNQEVLIIPARRARLCLSAINTKLIIRRGCVFFTVSLSGTSEPQMLKVRRRIVGAKAQKEGGKGPAKSGEEEPLVRLTGC